MPAQPVEGLKRKILAALAELPPLSTVKAISDKIGRPLSVRDMAPLVAGALVIQTEVKEAPIIRFTLAEKGRAWLDEHARPAQPPQPPAKLEDPPASPTENQTGSPDGAADPDPADDTAESPSKHRNSSGDVARLYRRFAGGEGTTAESKEQLAQDFNTSTASISKHLTRWRKAQRKEAAAQMAAPDGNGRNENAPTQTTAPFARISPADRDRLYARFVAGEGQTAESRKALGQEFGLLPSTVYYHLNTWKKAQGTYPATAHQPPVETTAPAGNGPVGTTAIDGDDFAPEIEQPTGHIQQASEGAAFDADAGTPETEQPAPPEMATEPQAASTDPAASSTENPGASTPPAPPDTAMAHALAKVGLVPAGTGTQIQAPQVKPGRRLRCQVCHEPVDTFLWYTDTKSGLSGHKGCVQPAAALQGEERVPVVGQICEGTVFTVDAGGMYALIELTEFTDHHRMHPYLRGKVTRAQVLRHGWCEDVRDWLQDGDLVNVKVLDIQADPHKGRYRINLSIKQAPPHAHERIPLEVSEPAPPEEPIVARGAEVAAALAEEPVSNVGKGAAQAPIISAILESDGTIRDVKVLTSTPTAAQLPAIVVDLAQHQPGPDETERTQAAIAAADLCRQQHLDPRHVDDLTERILEAGVPQVTAELEADLKTMAELKATSSAARAAALDQAATALSREDVDPDRIAERVAPQLHDQLLAAQLEIEQLRAALDAKRAEARRMVRGLCPSCFHGIDGFCPYVDLLEETYELPDENLAERHHGRRIVFGRRPVINCDLYRGDCTAAD